MNHDEIEIVTGISVLESVQSGVVNTNISDSIKSTSSKLKRLCGNKTKGSRATKIINSNGFSYYNQGPYYTPILQYKSVHWNRVLKGREFTDDGKRYVILMVEYKRADINNYVCDVIEKGNQQNNSIFIKKADRPSYVLYSVLKEAKKGKEEWYSNEYDAAIKELEARDRK